MKQYNVTPATEFLQVSDIVTVFGLRLSAKYRSLPETLTFWKLFFLRSGAFTTCAGGKEYPLEEGELLIVPPYVRHEGFVRGERSAQVSIVTFRSSAEEMNAIRPLCVYRATEAERILLDSITAEGVRAFELIRHSRELKGLRLREHVTPDSIHLIKVQLEHLLLLLWRRAREEDRPHAQAPNRVNYERAFVDGIKSFLSERLTQNVDVESLVVEFGISRSQIARLFKKHEGCGVIEIFQRMKMEHARRLIRESSMNFTQIAQTLGYGSVHYFSRMFKQYTGMTPTAYAAGAQAYTSPDERRRIEKPDETPPRV